MLCATCNFHFTESLHWFPVCFFHGTNKKSTWSNFSLNSSFIPLTQKTMFLDLFFGTKNLLKRSKNQFSGTKNQFSWRKKTVYQKQRPVFWNQKPVRGGFLIVGGFGPLYGRHLIVGSFEPLYGRLLFMGRFYIVGGFGPLFGRLPQCGKFWTSLWEALNATS